MTDLPVPTEIDTTIALDWLRYSLGQGEAISPSALKLIAEHEGHIYALAPQAVDPARLATPRWGGVTGTHAAQDGLAKVLGGLAERGASCLMVEDEIRLRRDPRPSVDGLLRTAFVGEAVVHWAELVPGTEDAIRMLQRGSGGHPTNAFVTSASPVELRLADGANLDPGVADTVVGSLMAVVVAAYDAETYIVWEPTVPNAKPPH
jgi:hypothetical protein